jgi:putative transposase
MHPTHFTITGRPLRSRALDLIGKALRLHPYGRLAADRIGTLILAAAAWRISLSATCGRLRDAPSHETARQALLAQLPPDIADLRARLAEGLADSLPADLRGRRLDMAVDLVLRPFYGAKATPGVARGPAKAGTKAFWAYATCMVLARGRRYTVALTEVPNGQPSAEVLERLWQQARDAGALPRRLLMDRGFYSAKVVDWLHRHHLAYIIPMVKRGRKTGPDGELTGTQRFFRRQDQGFASYRWESRDGDVAVSVGVAGTWSRGKMRVFIYGGWTPGSVREVLQQYRSRFRIETGYRQIHQATARSASTDARVRLVWMAVAAILRNLWVWWHDRVLSEPRPGRRRLRLKLLPLATMLEWIKEEVVQELGRVRERTVRILNPRAPCADICP